MDKELRAMRVQGTNETLKAAMEMMKAGNTADALRTIDNARHHAELVLRMDHAEKMAAKQAADEADARDARDTYFNDYLEQ